MKNSLWQSDPCCLDRSMLVAQMRIAATGNTVIPALLALERLGFQIALRNVGAGQIVVAIRRDEEYIADDPVAVLGLIKLIELRHWDWKATDQEIEATRQKYHLDG